MGETYCLICRRCLLTHKVRLRHPTHHTPATLAASRVTYFIQVQVKHINSVVHDSTLTVFVPALALYQSQQGLGANLAELLLCSRPFTPMFISICAQRSLHSQRLSRGDKLDHRPLDGSS